MFTRPGNQRVMLGEPHLRIFLLATVLCCPTTVPSPGITDQRWLAHSLAGQNHPRSQKMLGYLGLSPLYPAVAAYTKYHQISPCSFLIFIQIKASCLDSSYLLHHRKPTFTLEIAGAYGCSCPLFGPVDGMTKPYIFERVIVGYPLVNQHSN